MEENKKVIEENKENGNEIDDIEFVDIFVFKDRVKEVETKSGKKAFIIQLKSDENGKKPKNYLSFILSEKRLSKLQPKKRDDMMRFWLVEGEKIKVTESIKNKETGQYERRLYKEVDASTIDKMTNFPIASKNKNKEVTNEKEEDVMDAE